MGLILGDAEGLDNSGLREVERLLYREAALLDDRAWQEWLALYTEDCFYWVPSTTGQADPVNTISLFAENRMMMEMRIIRISHPRAFSQEFPTRMSHVVGNVTIDAAGGATRRRDKSPRRSRRPLEPPRPGIPQGGTAHVRRHRPPLAAPRRRRLEDRAETHRFDQLRRADGDGAALSVGRRRADKRQRHPPCGFSGVTAECACAVPPYAC